MSAPHKDEVTAKVGEALSSLLDWFEANIVDTSRAQDEGSSPMKNLPVSPSTNERVQGDGNLSSPNPFGLFPEIHETDKIAGSFSTWFQLWGCVIGAAHSVEAWGDDPKDWPEWTQGKQLTIRTGEGLDVAVFGTPKLPDVPPPSIVVGMPIKIRGFPAGVTVLDHYEIRNGVAYLDRPTEFRNGEAPSWIIKHNSGEILSMGGMSGGVGTVTMKNGKEAPVAILITQNGRADLDGKGVQSHSSDVVEARDVYDDLKAMGF